MIWASLVIWRSDFVISFAWLPIGNFAIAGVDFQIAKVRRKKYASPHLVYLRWLHRGMRGQGAHAFASIDHLDSRAWYSRLDHRRRRNPPVLSAKCRRQISSRRINCFNRWGDSSLIHLAQVQTAAPSRITNRFGTKISVVRTDRGRSSARLCHGESAMVGPFPYSSAKLTWISSILGWDCARSRFPKCEKRPLCLYR